MRISRGRESDKPVDLDRRRIMDLKVFDDNTRGTRFWVEAAITEQKARRIGGPIRLSIGHGRAERPLLHRQ